MDKVRILFLPIVDAANTNAQSLNAREIALRLDSNRLHSTLYYEHEPDPRLQGQPGISLQRLPSQHKTFQIVKELLAGYDIISYVDYSPASYLFVHLPRVLRRTTKAVFHAEAPMAQMINPSRSLRFLSQGVLPRCDVYTGITEFVARDISGATKRKVSHILPVGVDSAFFRPSANRERATPVVLFAGTLIERKGPQHVIEAAQRFPNAIFRIVGAGRQGFEQTLQRQIDQMGIRNVSLEGPRTQLEMLEIMQNSDIFLLPSRLEGIPKVTLEAAATGLPCIVFRDYETPSVVDNVTGFQVGSLAEMMEGLGKLIADRSLREQMGAAARQHMEKFDWDVISRQWQNAYLEIAAARVK